MISWERFKKTKAAGMGIVLPKFQEAATDYQDNTLAKEGERIKNCGMMIKAIGCKKCGEKFFKGYARCKSKYCPTCSALKGAIWCAKLYPLLQQWLEKGNNIHFATFTIPDQEDLEYALKIIYDAWRYMTNKLVPKEWKERFAGGVKAVECKIGKYSGKWHVHIHALVLRTGYRKDAHFLKENWSKAVHHVMGENIYVAWPNIKPIKAKDGSKNRDKLLWSVCETVKYATKINPDMETYRVAQAFYGLKNRRQISCWGVLYGISKLVEKEMDEESDNLIKSFKCTTCGFDISEFLEIWENTGKYWQDTEMKNYKEAVEFVEKPIELDFDKNYWYDEEDNICVQTKFI